MCKGATCTVWNDKHAEWASARKSTSARESPMPTYMAPPIMGNCPQFTPTTYQHWKRDVKFRTAGFPTATGSQLLSKIIAVLPQPAKITGLAYMELADGSPETRRAQALIAQLDTRYAKTDTERPWAWLQEFASFPRKPTGELKDFRARLLRVAT